MLLTSGQNILRVHTVKRMQNNGVYEMIQNRHDFLFTGDFNPPIARACIKKVALAELHTLMPEVETLFQVGYWFNALNYETGDFQCAGNFHRQYGGRHIEPGDVAVEFPVAVLVRSYPVYGRAGKGMFRGILRERDVRRSEAAGVQLRGNYEESGLTMAYFNAIMREAPYPAVVTDFGGGSKFPTAARTINSWGIGGAVRLSSVADAQLRKTFKAKPYREAAHYLAYEIALAGQLLSEILLYDGARVPFERVSQFGDLVRPIVARAKGLAEYWEKGREEDFAICWRPTAGLEPYIMEGRQTLDDLQKSGERLGEMIGQVIRDDEDRVDRAQVEEFTPNMERIAAFYVLLMQRIRWTGTPIPHPNVAGMCRA